MARIETTLSEEENAAWRVFCEKKGVSGRQALRELIRRVTQIDSESEEPKDVIKRSGRVRSRILIRLTEEESVLLENRYSNDGFKTKGAWGTAVILSVLHESPVFNEDEMTLLRESNRQLAAVGRNLNQIARAINSDENNIDQASRAFLAQIQNEVSVQKESINGLLEKTSRRWEGRG